MFFSTLAFAFVEPFFFIGYLISIALFGLYQAIFMANAGGAWDNAKKIVETELKMKGTPLHDATVVGDTVGDPFKDTSSVAMNPVIKFTTLFGLLAVELGVFLTALAGRDAHARRWPSVFFADRRCFVWRSFYGMRISGTAPRKRADRAVDLLGGGRYNRPAFAWPGTRHDRAEGLMSESRPVQRFSGRDAREPLLDAAVSKPL